MYAKRHRLFKTSSCSNLTQKHVPQDIIGQTTITDIKEDRKITVYLYQKKNISNQNENIYELRLLENNQNVLLGAIKFFKIKRINEFQDNEIYSEYHKRKIAYSNKDDDILFFSSTSLYAGKHNKEKVIPKILVWDGNMCLPDSSIKKWDRIIENDPVLYKTQDIQKKIFYMKKTGIVMGVKSDLDNQLTNKKMK
ncbi:MAG: hypothetical protein HYX60_00660 [Legionella longbeachae]|nr:hypothetical protein [Legionella longbeachae]